MRKKYSRLLLLILCMMAAGYVWSQSVAKRAKHKPIEPIGCVSFLLRSDPDSMASELNCRVGWLYTARTYFVSGGQSTQKTNQQVFQDNKKRTIELLARLSQWIDEVQIDSKTTPYEEANPPLMKMLLKKNSNPHMKALENKEVFENK